MSKRNFPTRIDPINLPRRLREGLDEANKLLERGKTVEALNLLEELDKRYPNQVYVLEVLALAYHDLRNNPGYLRAMQKLHRLKPNRPDFKLGMAEAYMANGYFNLALVTFREFLKRWPQHEQAGQAREAVQVLEEKLPKILAEAGLNFESDLEFACRNEEVQVCMNTGEYARAKTLVEKMQREKPEFVPALNNLSQVYWLEGDLPRAIETCQRVLAIKPDNIHALANLVRYLYLAGRSKEEAAPFIERLKTSQAPAADRWLKIAEALVFIGDDAGMLALAEQAVKEAASGELNGYFYHFWAVSEAMTGREKEAKSHWQRALKLAPYLEIVRENLEDLKKPPHERKGPVAFQFVQMISLKTVNELERLTKQAASRRGEGHLLVAVQRFLDAHPGLIEMAPLFLERGDAHTKEFVIMNADVSGHPGLLSRLKEYAFGQKGSDESRLKAAQILSKHNFIPPGQIKMWIRGKWQPILLLGFEVTPEPMLDQEPLKPQVVLLMRNAMQALYGKKWAEAEAHLRKALAVQPEHPSLLNNLALALTMQGKDEGETIAEHVMKDFPDYFIGQMALAQNSILHKQYDKAQAILDEWMGKKKRFHVSEFNMLCKTQIELSIGKNELDSALSWLKIWETTEPQDPDFEEYQERLDLLKRLSGSRKTKSRTH